MATILKGVVVIPSISLTRLGVCWSSRPNQHYRAKEFTEPCRKISGAIEVEPNCFERAVRIENSNANCEEYRGAVGT